MFTESELIMQNGRIYHLDILPEELADLVLTVGDPGRVPQVSKYFDSVEVKHAHREIVVHTGYIGKKRLTVLSTGMGTGGVDIIMNELDALVNIDLEKKELKPEKRSLNIVRLGTTGGLQEDIPVDSLVVSAYAVGFDGLMLFYKPSEHKVNHEILHALKEHMQIDIPMYVGKACSKLTAKLSKIAYTAAITATAPGFYAPQGRVLRGALAFPEFMDMLKNFSWNDTRITNFEMETAAILGLGNVLGHHTCAISAVVNNRTKQKFSPDIAKCVENLIQKSLEALTAE